MNDFCADKERMAKFMSVQKSCYFFGDKEKEKARLIYPKKVIFLASEIIKP